MIISPGRERPNRGPRPGAGFTLIEVMVVVLLVGLVATFAVINLGGDQARERQQREARRVLARMDLAREEAVLRARSLGIRFADDGYRFFELRREQWRPLTGDGVLAARSLQAPLSIEVEIDGLDVSLAGDDDGDESASGLGLSSGDEDEREGDGEDEDTVRPQLFFLPGGEIMPDFTITVLSDDTDTEYRITPGDEQWLALSEHRF